MLIFEYLNFSGVCYNGVKIIFIIFIFMKKHSLSPFGLAACMLVFLSACSAPETPISSTTPQNSTEETTTPVEETTSGPVAFADVDMGLMDAGDEYSLFTFEEGAGTCLDMGFPTDLVWDSKNNVVKTKDESYVEDWTSIDFAGNLRFDEVSLGDKSVACVIKATSGVTTANLTCSEESEDEDVEDIEVCTGTLKVYANM